MSDKTKALTVEEQLAAILAEQKAQKAESEKLKEALEIVQAENKALKATQSGAVAPEAIVAKQQFVRAKVSGLTLKKDSKTLKVDINPNFVETGHIKVRMKHKAGDTAKTLWNVKIDDALAKTAKGHQTDFSKKCLTYILANPKSVQWTVTTV